MKESMSASPFAPRNPEYYQRAAVHFYELRRASRSRMRSSVQSDQQLPPEPPNACGSVTDGAAAAGEDGAGPDLARDTEIIAMQSRCDGALDPWEGEPAFPPPNVQPAAPAAPGFTLDSVINDGTLLAALEQMQYRGQASGRDGVSYRDLGRSERWDVIRGARRVIDNGTYLPSEPKPVDILKPSGGIRTLQLRSVLDRIIARALKMALSTIIERVLLPSTMGFRPRRGVWHLLAHLGHTIATTGCAVVGQTDIQQAFPNLPISLAMDGYRSHIDDPGLLWLIETILRGHRGAAQTIGIEQGCPLSPDTLNLTYTHTLDRPLVTVGLEYPLFYRYVDNLVYLSSSVSDGRQRLSHIRDLLASHGLQLKQAATEHVDLRLPGAGINVLGYRLTLADGRLQVGLSKGAYAGLRESLVQAHAAPAPSLAAQQAVRGWLDAAGAAVENGEAGERLVQRVRQIAAGMGFRELDTQALRDSVRKAHQRWARLQVQVQQSRPC